MGKGRKSISRLTIVTYPRMHLTLIGMNTDGYRINGGIGFSVRDPALHIRINVSKEFQIHDQRNHPLSRDGQRRLLLLLQKTHRSFYFKNCIDILIAGRTPTHYGFGTGTAIRLGCLEALFSLNGVSIEKSKLRDLSRRGGTSGIGLHSYFSGGMILDLGRAGAHRIRPSSAAEGRKLLPLLLSRVPMPEWKIGICVPTQVPAKNERQERDFFAKHCPIPKEAVYETLYHVIYGLQASAMEDNFQTFCTALKTIQECTWKSLERSQYGTALRHLESALYQAGASVVAMSSLGPSLLFLARSPETVVGRATQASLPCSFIITTTVNHGRLLQYA